MFDQAKHMMDNAVNKNDALSEIERRRPPRRGWHRFGNIVLLVFVIAILIVFVLSR